MKRAAIDIGNTRIKAAIFDDFGEILQLQIFEVIDQAFQWFKVQDVQSFICSSVGASIGLEAQKNGINMHELTYKSILPFQNLYESKETLGTDRIAVMAAAAVLYKNQNVLVFDIGTCMTIDFIDENGIYKGGNISPGLDMRLKAMHTLTKRLPLADRSDSDNELGKNTTNAIANGASLGLQFEIDGYIQKFAELNSNLTIILCGGNTEYFDKTHKYKIFADQNFVLKGLYQLLLLNEK